MQTHFSKASLERPEIKMADDILRKCVHCGFCTATCPTFVLTGDERDSPRGRIWMMRDALGGGDTGDQMAMADVGYHLDRCLGCMSCMTTCPSGVDYLHLVDIGRAEVEKTATRPIADALIRKLLAGLVPRAGLFNLALKLARLGRPFAAIMPRRIAAMLRSAPEKLGGVDKIGAIDQIFAPEKPVQKRVILLQGCAQRAIAPQINAATLRLLSRLGVEVVVRQLASCCGGLAHHINESDSAHQQMAATARAWKADIDKGDLDAIIVNTSGCGTTLKDYAHLFSADAELAQTGEKIASLAMDITEFLAAHTDLPALPEKGLSVAYHAACSLQHGQKVTSAPKNLLANAGFEVRPIAESHLCCGSAGVYNILQPELAGQLQSRKIGNINKVNADIVAAGNLGCINQIAGADAPVCHTIQLLDWAYGGPVPQGLENLASRDQPEQG
ncbi:MAG: glycolate oxidase subunit GlcF [Candidatus Puniceispirillaceae bacterium]